MGKAPNGLGKFSGKVGGVVFAISNGEQIVRAYQPVVTNPKSSLQMIQRAKGNLTGRISSFVPKTAIMGLGNNNRRRRAEFLRQILRNTNVTQSGNSYNAKIDDDDVLFSKGSVITSVTNPYIVANPASMTVGLYGTNTMTPEEYASHLTRLVVMVYDSTTQELVEVVTKMAITPDADSSSNTYVTISHPAGYDAVVYAIPMRTEDGSAATITTDDAMKSDDDIAALLTKNANAIVFDYGKSYVLGQANYTPSQSKEDETKRAKKK